MKTGTFRFLVLTFAVAFAANWASAHGAYDYAEALHKSLLFYEAQRSGTLPPSNRIPWRRSAMENDEGNQGEDLSGGYFDAGDHVKFGLPMAWTVTVLAWGVIENKNRYETAKEYDEAIAAIKWGTDYFIKCHVAPYEFYGQVGDGNVDHSFWGRPEEFTGARPAWKLTKSKPGTEVISETAAAMAAAAIVFKDKGDTAYANTLISHARDLYKFGKEYRGEYHNSIPNAQSFYKSWSGFGDELAWSALWMHWATGESAFMADFNSFMSQYSLNGGYAFSWDEKHYGVQVLAAKLTGDSGRLSTAVNNLLQWTPGGSVQYTPMGLAWRQQWGPNRYAGNMAFLAFVLGKHLIDTNQQSNSASKLTSFAKSQVDYFLGDGPRSFVVGFGNNPPHSPHHRGASCPDRPAPCSFNEFNSPNPNPQILYGALVGGPGTSDEFIDDRKDYIKNEVATDYNAGFQGALAFLVDGPPTSQPTTSPPQPTTTPAQPSTTATQQTTTASLPSQCSGSTTTVTTTLPATTRTVFSTITQSITTTQIVPTTTTQTITTTTSIPGTTATVTSTEIQWTTSTLFPEASETATVTETKTVEVTKTSTCAIGQPTNYVSPTKTSSPVPTSSPTATPPSTATSYPTSGKLPSKACKFHFLDPRYPTVRAKDLSLEKTLITDFIVLASDGSTPVSNCQSRNNVMYYDASQNKWIKSDLLSNVLYIGSGKHIKRRVIQTPQIDEFKSLLWKWIKIDMSCQFPNQNEINCVEIRLKP
eukprot:Nk52_evm139s226 gene=Nk52_evmTU139s226